MSNDSVDAQIQAEFDLSELIEIHEDTDWSEVPGITVTEAEVWTERLRRAQAKMAGLRNGAETDLALLQASGTAAAYAIAGGDEYDDLQAEYRVRGPTSDQRVELVAETGFGELALTLDPADAQQVSRELNNEAAECGTPDRPE